MTDHTVLLGPTALEGFVRHDRVAELPPDALVVIVELTPEVDARVVADVHRRAPDARLIGFLPRPSEAEVQRCLDFGLDALAFGAAHLHHVLTHCAAELELRQAEREQQQLHAGLVSLIGEISDHPDLGDVLRIAVVRMAELFDVDRVSVVIFEPGDDVGFVVAEHEESLVDSLVIRLEDYPEIGAIIRSREPLVIPDVLGDSLLRGVRSKLEHAKAPPRSSVLFPLQHKGEVVGALFLRAKDRLGPVERRLLDMGRLVAIVTSVAIGAALEHETLVSEQRRLARKKAEADQKLAGLQQFSAFFAQAHDGIIFTDSAGAIRYTNAAAGELLRRDPAALRDMVFPQLVAQSSRALAERALRGDAVGDAHGYIDLLVPLAGEREIVISAALRFLEAPRGILISFRDVTELREIEAELRQTRDFLENLIQSSVDAIVAADTEGRIILFNRAAEHFLGYRARDVIGKMSVNTIYPPGEAQDVMRRLRSEAYGGVGRLEMTRKDLLDSSGRQVPVSLTASIIYEDGREVASVGIFTDLRDRLRIEEKLARVQRQLQSTERQAVAAELAGAAAHELSQPLTSILGYAEMMRRRLEEGDPRRKAVDVICREAERMGAIVKKIGQITAYHTKPYVGSSQIIDLERGNQSQADEQDQEVKR